MRETRDNERSPRVFISYSHDDAAHKEWVTNLGSHLLQSGVEVILDLWDLKPGADTVQFMTRSVIEADRVLMICTKQFVAKVNGGKGGSGFESMVVTGQLIRDLTTTKFIPIIRQTGENILPDAMETRLYIDFSDDQKYDTSFELLLRELHNIPAVPRPSLGANPFKQPMPAPAASPAMPDSKKRILEALQEADQDDLIRAFFRRQLTLSALDDVCDKYPDSMIEMLPHLSERGWGAMFSRYIARRLCHRVEDFLSVAFNPLFHWGIRVMAVEHIKHAEKETKRRARQVLMEHIDDTNIDNIRIILYGFGALGDNSSIQWVSKKHNALTANYQNEKLGTVLVESLISAYINTTDEPGLPYYPGAIVDAYDKTRKLGHMGLVPLHFFALLRYLPKSRARFLLEALDPKAHAEILLGLLYTLLGLPNPYLIDQLHKLIQFHNAKHDALMAIAAIGTPTSHSMLKSLVNDSDAATAICYSIGLSHIEQDTKFLLQTLELNVRGAMCSQYAVWSLGELASNGNTQALDQLHREKEQFSEGYIRALALLGLAKSGQVGEAELKESLEATTYYFERVIIGIAGAYVDSLEMVETGVLTSYRNFSALWGLQAHFMNDLRHGLRRGHPDIERELTILLKS